MIDIGLLHQFEELARIGRQRFDVAPLALGIDGVERQARFAAARQPGDHRQRIARDVDVDILEIMLARAADGDRGKGHSSACSRFVLDPQATERGQGQMVSPSRRDKRSATCSNGGCVCRLMRALPAPWPSGSAAVRRRQR